MRPTLAWLLVFGITVARAESDDKTPAFKITSKRDNDTVAVAIENGSTVLSIRSPTGISQCTVERVGEKWPDAVVLRLYLKGLESFRVASGDTKLSAAVSSTADRPAVRFWKNGNENAPLDPKDRLWMEIRAVDRNGKPAVAIPIDGYFEMKLSAALFESNPKSITIEWIDFYRG